LFIFGTYLNIVQINPEAIKMQTLVAEIAITFVDDAIALIKGCGRIVVQTATAPIERLATACDVAGVLPQSRSSLRTRARVGYARTGLNERTARPRRRRWQLRNCMCSFRSLGNLT
jgi:hypothetical protein